MRTARISRDFAIDAFRAKSKQMPLSNRRTRIRREQCKHAVIKPPPITPFGLPRNALETKTQSTDHPKRCVIVRRRRDAYTMRTHVPKCKLDRRSCRLGHETTTHAFLAKPISKVALTMKVHAGLETHDTDKRSARTLANGETDSASMIPVCRTRLGKTQARRRLRMILDPRKPLRQERSRTAHSKPHFLGIRWIDRRKREPLGLDGPSAKVCSRWNDERGVHGQTNRAT